VPKDRDALTKPEIAIEEVDRVIACAVSFGGVLADSGYGSSGPFRSFERARSAVGGRSVTRQNVYAADIT